VPIRPEAIRSQGVERDEDDVAAGTRREGERMSRSRDEQRRARRTIRYGGDSPVDRRP
jgi:hypothetical protein